MIKTRVIRIFSFIMALTLVFAMISTPAYAVSPRQFNAWIASALTALNITFQSTVVPYYDALDYFTDPFQINEGILDYVPYSYPLESVDDYLEQSTLSFKQDKVIIDGKEYQDIWLSNEAAEKFRVNAFDLKSAFNIANNSTGTFVSGEGFFANGIPAYRTNQWGIQSQIMTGLRDGSNFGHLTFKYFPSLSRRYGVQYSGGYSGLSTSPFPWCAFYRGNNGYLYFNTSNDPSSTNFQSFNGAPSPFHSEPFDFDWVSSVIPADEPLDSDEGLHLRVPTDPTQWPGDTDVQDVINNYNNYINTNPEFTPGVDIDLNDPGVLDKVGDILDILSPIIKLLLPEFGPKNQEPPPAPIEPDPQPDPYPDPEPVPYPDPDPDPTTPLTDINWKNLFDVLKNIFQKLANIDVTTQTIANKLVEFRNRFEDWMQSIRDSILNKLNDIQNLITDFFNAVNYRLIELGNFLLDIWNTLQDILDSIADLADKIVNGNADWFNDIVDSIRNPFMRWFGILKSGVGIWHWVVEWLQKISAPFTFFWNVMVNTSDDLKYPFYAVAAACIVIAIYRRFGR